MNFNLCPVCAHVNAANANFCNACGVSLVVPCPRCTGGNRPTAKTCHKCGATLPAGKSTSEEAAAPPAAARAPAADPDDLTLTLRPAEELPAAPGFAEAGPVPDAARRAAPPLPELVLSDPEWEASSVPASNGSQHVAPAAPPAASKAAHRAAVRRARLAGSTARPFPTFAPRDVLVLDQDAVARAELARLLEGFGFCPCPARDIAEAREMLAARPFIAVFLDVVLDGAYQSAQAELCQQVKHAAPHSNGRGPALIIVSDRARSVDRVRATLAGADGFLIKPAKRGDVVRALDECGVPLPSDSRQA